MRAATLSAMAGSLPAVSPLGIFSGMSAGANVWAALQIAERSGRGRRVVTIAPDSGLKYLQGHLFA